MDLRHSHKDNKKAQGLYWNAYLRNLKKVYRMEKTYFDEATAEHLE